MDNQGVEIITTSVTIDGCKIGSVIDDIWFKYAKEYVKESTESSHPAVCQISGIIPTDEEFMEELKRLDEKLRLKYSTGMRDYLEMLSMAQVQFRWDITLSQFMEALQPRGFLNGLRNVNAGEFYAFLMEEVGWIRETRC